MDFTEPDHVRQLRDTLERFVAREMPRAAAARWDRDNHFPRDVFDKLAQLGVLSLTVPEAYGGAGRDIVATMSSSRSCRGAASPSPCLTSWALAMPA